MASSGPPPPPTPSNGPAPVPEAKKEDTAQQPVKIEDITAQPVQIEDITEEPVKKEVKSTYPPFPKFDAPPPLSVADTIKAGRVLRAKDKALRHDAPVRPLPRPAKPRRPKVTDVPMSRRETHAHTCCLRKHGAVLTDRLEYMAKPLRRTIIYLWRDHADTLPPETIARLRAMLDADEPFKPDQAYEYFINLRKSKKATKKTRHKQFEKDMQSICANKRYVWARNATVAFARGVQERLRRPGRFALTDGMLRLSNIILNELCGYMRMKTPCRRSTAPKAKFMMEMADKVAVWIDGILAESDDRMLMMDFDEDVEPPAPKKKPPEPGPVDPKLVQTKSEDEKLLGSKSEAKLVEAKWVDAEKGQVPPGALAGGQTSSGEPVYVARAEHEKSITPGNLITSNGAAHVASGGAQHAKPKYQVLVGSSGKWQPVSGANVPADALPGGQSETGEVLYVGRAKHEGGLIVGKVQKSLGNLYIAFGGKEVAIKDYEILMK